MESDISIIQDKFNNLLTSKNLNYDKLVLPLCEEIMKLISKSPSNWPIIPLSKNIIDIYYETIYHFHYLNPNTEIPFELFLNLMSYRPLIYFVELMTKTYKEADVFKEKLKQTIIDIYGTGSYPKNIQDLYELITLEYPDISKISAITYFHYFIGFKFSESKIGIHEIPKDKGRVVINITHNLEYHDKNVYVYHEHKFRVGQSFLTKEIMDKFKPIESVEIKNKPKTLIAEKVIKDENYIVLKYNENNYTISDTILIKKEAERFINGALPMLISNEDFITYNTNIYYNNLPLILDSSEHENVLIPEFSKIYYEIISPIYQYYIDGENKFNYKEFVSKITENINEKYMNKTEIPLFKFYIENYVFEEFKLVDFIAYLHGYFD